MMRVIRRHRLFLSLIATILLPTIVCDSNSTSPSNSTSSNPPPTLADIPPAFHANASTRFDHETCIDRITTYLNTTITANQNSTIPYPLIFAKPDTAYLTSPTNMIITVPACQLLCSNPSRYRPFRDWYPDRGPRIMTWIVPVALLLSSIELSPLDKRRFDAVLHAVGDPVDVLWAFLHKLRVRTRIYALAHAYALDSGGDQDAVIAAVVLSAFEDLLSPDLRSYETFKHLLVFFWIGRGQGGDEVHEVARLLWRDAAIDLSDARSDERLRSMLAVALYVLQILSAFIVDIGGGPTNPPGGVIAVAATLTFLIPAVLFSSWIGAPTSRRGTLRAVKGLVERVERLRFDRKVPWDLATLNGPGLGPDRVRELEGWLLGAGIPLAERDKFGVPLVAQATVPAPFDWGGFHLNGGKDTYRPWKMRVLKDDPILPEQWWTRRRWREAFVRKDAPWEAFLASLPVWSGVAAGLGILSLAGEGGFSCRHVLLLSILGAWMASVVSTTLSFRLFCWDPARRSRELHWWFCLFKGLVVGTSVLGFVGMTAAGFFSSCSCWGRELIRGSGAEVNLSVNERNWENVRGKFPGIVSALLFFQVGFTVLVLRANRDGIRVLRWSETRRHAAWLNKELPPNSKGIRGRVRRNVRDMGFEFLRCCKEIAQAAWRVSRDTGSYFLSRLGRGHQVVRQGSRDLGSRLWRSRRQNGNVAEGGIALMARGV
ncbi:hypothetical protein QBC39DRAFT_412761 [Podospora conica]|nr:hypothetical protein QBC39DRAFT_412761 [Schizothecium conicum]